MRIFILCLLAAAASAFLLFETSYAQERPEYVYVDLVMRYELAPEGKKSSVAYTVENIGNATASGVTVSFRLEDLKATGLLNTPHLSDKKIVDSGANQGFTEFTWEAGTIPPGGTAQSLIFGTSRLSSQTTNLVGVINATASSFQPEPNILLANNVIKVYSYSDVNKRHMDGNRLALLLSVDNLRPVAGGDVEFGLTASNLNPAADTRFINLIANAKVKVELSSGLKFDDNWSPAGTTTSKEGDTTIFKKSNTEIFRIEDSTRRSGTWSPSDTDTDGSDNLSDDIDIETQLTADSLEDIPLKERCITAWVEDSKPPPSPDYVLGSFTQCLGDDPPVLFTKGSIGMLVPFPCIGIVNNICDSDGNGTSDSEVIVAAAAPLLDETVNLDTEESVDLALRSRNIVHRESFRNIPDAAFLLPEDVIIQVKDPEGRVDDTYSYSLTSSGPSWQTGRKTTGRTDESGAANRSVSGVLVTHTRKTFAAPWTALNQALSVTKDGADAQSKVRIRTNTNGRTTTIFPFDLNNPRNWTTFSTSVIPYFFEFVELGTYSVSFHVNATHSGTVYPPMEMGQHRYAKGTYTFHVGPIAELEVRDSGRNPAVSAGQRAYTITAVNNGPDTAPATQVTLRDVPAGATVGSISEGSYDAATGVWNIGELESAEYRRIAGQHEGAILTLLTSAAAEITATITNTQDYQVCIDSNADDVDAADQTACTSTTGNTWHTTKYYDYNEDNSTATIAARPGSGGSALRTSQSTSDVSLSWSPQTGAASYGIEVSDDGGATWQLLEPWRVVRGTGYTHTGIPVGATRHYRVHAIDSEGRRGLPFTTASAVAGRGGRETSPPGAPEQMTLAASPASRTEILLSWVKPADYGSAITGYTLQVADGRNGPWFNVEPQPGVNDVAYDYAGLEPNTRKYFRIRAANEFGGGLWSEVAEARTLAAGVPGPPQDVGAGPFGDNAISVFWNQPAEDGHAPVTQYEVQWSANGSTGWSRVGSTGNTTLNHTGLVAGDEYYYRVRARNSVGWGPWSQLPAPAVPTGVLRPAAPYPHAEPNGSTAMDIMWEPPYDEEWREDTTITGYQLEWSATGVEGTFRSLASPAATSRSYTHTGLTADTTYYYRMRARNSVGWGDWSETVEQKTGVTGLPGTPSLTVQANGSAEINLSWTKPASNGAPITGYELEYYSPDYQGWYWLTGSWVSADVTHYIDSGLEPGTERQYRIRANNENGPGQWSTARTARTDSGGPDAPTGLSAEPAVPPNSEKQIILTWTAPTGATSYRIERSRYEEGPWERLSNGHGTTTYTDSRNLYPGMTRYYRVAAMSRAGTGAYSSSVAGTTAGGPTLAPEAPTLLRFTSVGQNQVSFAWDRPPSDGGAPITGYEYRETYGEDITTTTGTSGTIRGLDDGLLYYSFEVRAVNAVGEGEWSESIYATLWAERSEQVRVSSTNITVTEGGTARFTVSLNRQPPLPVGLGLYPRGDGADDLLYGAYEYLDKALIPSGWSHPDGHDWSDRAHNWSQGVPVSITIPDDDQDNPDRVMVIDVSAAVLPAYEVGVYDDEWNLRWGIDPERPCPGDPESTCPTEWDTAPWRDFTGPSVKITVRDND